MKILQIGKFYPIRGGVEKVMYDLTLGLSESGIDCDMLCAVTENHPAGTVRLNQHANLICVSTLIKFAATMISPAMIFKLRKIRKDYDIIHIHHPDPMACLALFFSGYKGKVVLHWHSDILKQKLLLKLFSPLQNLLIKRADKIVGTTPVYVEQSPFLKNHQFKVDYIPIGILPIEPNESEVVKIKQQYPNKKIVFSLGRLVEYKGYEYLVESAQYLPENTVVLIGGTGPLRAEIEALILEKNLQGKVILLGFVADDDISTYFGACDLFCLSSTMKTEAFAIVQIEAMSCSKPIISTEIPESGVSWVNQTGISGLTVPIKDGKAFGIAINQILTDENLYNKFQSGSFQRFSDNFTHDSMIEKCKVVYNEILDPKLK